MIKSQRQISLELLLYSQKKKVHNEPELLEAKLSVTIFSYSVK